MDVRSWTVSGGSVANATSRSTLSLVINELDSKIPAMNSIIRFVSAVSVGEYRIFKRPSRQKTAA